MSSEQKELAIGEGDEAREIWLCVITTVCAIGEPLITYYGFHQDYRRDTFYNGIVLGSKTAKIKDFNVRKSTESEEKINMPRIDMSYCLCCQSMRTSTIE